MLVVRTFCPRASGRGHLDEPNPLMAGQDKCAVGIGLDAVQSIGHNNACSTGTAFANNASILCRTNKMQPNITNGKMALMAFS